MTVTASAPVRVLSWSPSAGETVIDHPPAIACILEGFCPECHRPLDVCPGAGVNGDDWLCCWSRDSDACCSVPLPHHYRVECGIEAGVP